MARKRMIHPSIWDDPDLSQLQPIERLLFIGLVSLADDYGHIAGNPKLLQKWVFGYDNLPPSYVETMRDRIVSCCRNVELYEVDDQQYLWLKKWERHQDLRFRGPAQYPCHACGRLHKNGDYQACVTLPCDLRSTTQVLTQDCAPDYVTLDYVTLDKNILDNRVVAPDGAEKDTSKPPKRPKRPRKTENLPPQGFEEFWEAYPRKKARAEAEKAYEKLLNNGVTPENLRAGAEHYAQECILVDREEQYISFPASFLNKRRFEDFQQPPAPAKYRSKMPVRGKPIEEGPTYEPYVSSKRA